MGKIHILDDQVINKIAAGEVIERPASVVKELIENALDAHAHKIFIDLIDGGKSSIRVSDDGDGMDQSDAKLCVTRHATSKLSRAQDLSHIETLGFRGEALSSIAAVARITIKTNAGAREGTLIEIEGGTLIREEPFVMPRGTTIIVNDLFFNVPARQKHLKTTATELATILDTVARYSLANHDVYFEVVHDGKVLLNSPENAHLLNTIANIYGKEVASNLLEITNEADHIRISGFISKQGYQRNDRTYQALFINGRSVANKLISDAIYEGYKTHLNVNKHPVYVIHVHVGPAMLDVNVHPQKSKVRILEEDHVYRSVVEAIQRSLPQTERAPEKVLTRMRDLTLERFKIKDERQRLFIEKQPQSFRILGQLLKSYAVAAVDDGFIIVDQHAAQERVMYEKYLKQYHGDTVSIQTLLEPLTLELTAAESVLIGQYRALLRKLGFEIEDFGKNAFLLRTVPDIFNKLQGRDIFLAVLDELKTEQTGRLDKIHEELVIRRACKSSIKANRTLEIVELIDVVKELFGADQPYTCPHGRPTMVKFSNDDIEKMFRRKGL